MNAECAEVVEDGKKEEVDLVKEEVEAGNRAEKDGGETEEMGSVKTAEQTEVAEKENESPGQRKTICFPRHGTQVVMQSGEDGFVDETRKHYADAESKALEELIELKARLRDASTTDFFDMLTEGISRILGADICFVMKRMLVDDHDSAVEMPPHGEPGSCLMAAALHYCANDGKGTRIQANGTKYHAWACPCAYMKHDKIFVIPDRLNEFITNNPNKLPYPLESYIAVPLWSEGKCFAHFGVMWTADSCKTRKLSWANIELIMHSLEDMVLNRLLEGSNFVQSSAATAIERPRVIPHEAITVAQSLRPYAGSLSHELRTPMQGVVGMLDVMYATVQEAVEGHVDPRLQKIFATLKENIEAVQDSSRRAVEAADNVVHAYDMDMSVPDAPVELLLDEVAAGSATPVEDREKRPDILVAGSNLPISRPNKRRRDEAFSRAGSDVHPQKLPKLVSSGSECRCADRSLSLDETTQSTATSVLGEPQTPRDETLASHDAPYHSSRIIAPGLRHTNLRELIQHVINEGLTVGGRPDSALAHETELGETIEVRIRGSDGTVGMKIIEWSVDRNVPDTLFIDEMDLSKLISRVFLNAIKFTDSLSGRIKLHAAMSQRGKFISIKIIDNGPGMPAAFLPRLFKPFSQEDPSLTRSTEGLGLGLMVAKGIARKLGGDLLCTRTETEGPRHGTEFEVKVPLHAGETISRPNSPFGSPLPRKAQPVAMLETPAAFKQAVPYTWTAALQEVADRDAKAMRTSHPPIPSTPPTPPSPRSLLDGEPAALISNCMPMFANSTGSSSNVSPTTTTVAVTAAAATTAAPVAPPPRVRRPVANPAIDRDLAKKYPLNFLVAEDNKINRKLLVSMLAKFGYQNIYEAHDGAEAVRQVARSLDSPNLPAIDVVLMDLWMPLMDGYEATRRIFQMWPGGGTGTPVPTVLAVTADVTDGALERAARVGMKGFMSKPYKLVDLQRLITEYCVQRRASGAVVMGEKREGRGEMVPAAA